MTAVAETPIQKEASLWQRLTDRWVIKLIILLIIILWLVPTLGVLISSFRPAADVNANGWWTVFGNLATQEWTFDNYSDVLSAEGFGNAFLNSLAVTIPSTVIPITIAAFAAYAFAWMEFPGRQWIFVAVVALLLCFVVITWRLELWQLQGGSSGEEESATSAEESTPKNGQGVQASKPLRLVFRV